MYHYTYKIEFETGHVYFGSRSCECLPRDDSYLGSPVTYKAHWKKFTPTKVILRTFDTRQEACEYENVLIEWCWSVNRSLSLNATIGGTKFSKLGVPHSQKTIELMKIKARLKADNEGKEFEIISPEGIAVKVKGLARFCRENNTTQAAILSLLKGKVQHHKGWTSTWENHTKYKETYELRGLNWHKGRKRWRLHLSILENKKIYLGCYKDLQIAKFARDLAEVIWDQKCPIRSLRPTEKL